MDYSVPYRDADPPKMEPASPATILPLVTILPRTLLMPLTRLPKMLPDDRVGADTNQTCYCGR